MFLEPTELEVCVPECDFLGTGFFPYRSRKSSIPSIWEHPLPAPNSVWAFRTGFFPSCFRPGNIREFPYVNLTFFSKNGVLTLQNLLTSWWTSESPINCSTFTHSFWRYSVIRLSSVYICAWFVELHECKHCAASFWRAHKIVLMYKVVVANQ